jgi:hypothetical protein
MIAGERARGIAPGIANARRTTSSMGCICIVGDPCPRGENRPTIRGF